MTKGTADRNQWSLQEVHSAMPDLWTGRVIGGEWGRAKIVFLKSLQKGPIMMIAGGPDCSKFFQKVMRLRTIQIGALILVESDDDPIPTLKSPILKPILEQIDHLIFVGGSSPQDWPPTEEPRFKRIEVSDLPTKVVKSMRTLRLSEADTADKLL